MYSDRPRGNPPTPPALLATVVLLQAYTKCSDFDAVSNALHDTRWQMALDCFDPEEAPFGEATLADFRTRLVSKGMAPRLLQRTVDLAKETKGFGYKQAAGLRIAIDSVPLDGAGKVEDTINLLGHALRLLLRALAVFLALKPEAIAVDADLPVLVAPSTKAGLDLDWHAPDAGATALRVMIEHIERLTAWMTPRLAARGSTVRIEAAHEQLSRIVDQDTVPDGAGRRTLREGVAAERQISISDPEMRHGRKSATERIDGYKEYVATDLPNDLTLAAAVLPANVPEAAGADKLRPAIEVHGTVQYLAIDCAFLASDLCATTRARPDGEVVCRSIRLTLQGRFTKADFAIDVAAGTVRCPAGHLAVIQSAKAHFPAATCGACPQRASCQPAGAKQGRAIRIHPAEPFFQALRAAEQTPEGRARLRERTAVEHKLAHQRNRQPRFARYRGVAKNDFDAQRTAAVNNLLVIDRRLRRAGLEVLDEVA
ncbi:MAG TPA: transposase [Burkholderiales bacterium]|nr:transposase [Burkholderiales bacterium]